MSVGSPWRLRSMFGVRLPVATTQRHVLLLHRHERMMPLSNTSKRRWRTFAGATMKGMIAAGVAYRTHRCEDEHRTSNTEHRRNSKMKVGVPKEIKPDEYRVAMMPVGVELMVKNGHEVFVEAGAGVSSGFPDEDYKKVGATIVKTHEEAIKSADLVVKVKEPMPPE